MHQETVDWRFICTTIFAPLEYGSLGYSEEQAAKDNITCSIYHSLFKPLEWEFLGKAKEDLCYLKLICDKNQNDKVIGLHFLGPNAGEVCMGFLVAVRKGATKYDFDSTIGIHPTCAENFTTILTDKNSGKTLEKGGC